MTDSNWVVRFSNSLLVWPIAPVRFAGSTQANQVTGLVHHQQSAAAVTLLCRQCHTSAQQPPLPAVAVYSSSSRLNMTKRTCADCARTAGIAMRVLVSTNILCAICLLVFGCTVERPINSFPPVAMIILSFLSLASAITGLVGGHKWACCLDAFLVLHSLDTLLKTILVIVLWVDFNSVVNAIDPKQTGLYDRAHVTQVLKAAKWLLLLFLLCEAAALVLSLLLRFVLDPTNAAQRYNNFDESNMQERALNMQSLRSDVENQKFSTTSNSIYKKVTAKMHSKYGQFSQIKWKKSWFGL